MKTLLVVMINYHHLHKVKKVTPLLLIKDNKDKQIKMKQVKLLLVKKNKNQLDKMKKKLLLILPYSLKMTILHTGILQAVTMITVLTVIKQNKS